MSGGSALESQIMVMEPARSASPLLRNHQVGLLEDPSALADTLVQRGGEECSKIGGEGQG